MIRACVFLYCFFFIVFEYFTFFASSRYADMIDFDKTLGQFTVSILYTYFNIRHRDRIMRYDYIASSTHSVLIWILKKCSCPIYSAVFLWHSNVNIIWFKKTWPANVSLGSCSSGNWWYYKIKQSLERRASGCSGGNGAIVQFHNYFCPSGEQPNSIY